MSVPIPPVSNETQEHLEKRIQAMVSHFTPEWTSDGDRVGKALIRIFAALTQETLDRLNRTPRRNMLAFLDMMGIRLLPKSSALAFLCFHVADGTSQSVIVPARTLVTASSPSGEIPFETEKDLNANPGGISGLFGVDPANDAIYETPKGFLQKSIVGPTLPDYTTAAFSAAKSQSVQLDLVDGIEPGDTLRIAGSDYVVKEIKGRIVELLRPLRDDVNTGALVLKRTTFELFSGIDLQEHIFYLSHSEYLQIKEAAVITLVVKAAQTGDPTDVVWESFIEDKEKKVEEWTTLPISEDTTEGLSRTGKVVVLKPKGEIKEVEIGGQTVRWIRARRKARIAPLDRLSSLDSVQLIVESSQDPREKPLLPDAGFYNEAPVSVTAPPFNPLGFEPQLFDRFQLASAEAFSKIGADVTLDFKLDLSRLLGPPSVVAAPTTLLRVFARGVLTRLTEVAPSRNTFLEIKNAPSPTAPGAIPAAVALPSSDYTGVFVRCSDNSIQLLAKATLDGPDAWVILDKPGGKDVRLDPAGVAVPGRGQWIVFAVADDKLWHKTTSPGGGAGQPWRTESNPGFTPKSPPAAALDVAGNPVVFVFDDQSKLWRVQFSFVGSDWEGQPGELLPTPALSDQDIYKTKSLDETHTFALDGFGAHPPTVFFANLAGGITAVSGAAGRDLGAPTNQQSTADPCCVLLFDKAGNPDHLRVFAAFGDERKLYRLLLDLNLTPTGDWTGLSNPQAVSGRPSAVRIFPTQYRLFAAGGQGSMMQLTARTETGIVTEVDSSQMLFLSQSVPLVNPSGFPRSARIPSTPASAPPEPLVEPFDGPSLARFQNIRPGLLLGSSYQLFEALEVVTAKGDSTGATVRLNPPTTVAFAPDLWIFVDSVSPEFAGISGIPFGDTITLAAPLTTSPAAGDSCTIFRRLHQGATARGTTNQVLLDDNAQPSRGAYEDAEIEIGNARTLVQSYDHVNRVVELKSAIGVNLDSYRFPDQWSQLEDPALDDIDPTLSWEYWNGKGWANLLKVKDETEDLVREGKVHFPIPPDITPTEVAGQSNYWIRARLVGGNYGQVRFEVISKTDASIGETTYTTERKDLSRPPIVKSLTISYSLAREQFPKTLLTLNNLDYTDQTAANITDQKSFEPFARLDTAEKALYLGFDQQISSGSVLFAMVQELPADDSRKLVWEALFQNRFQEIDVQDTTALLTHLAGLVELDIPFVAEKRQLLGVPAYWTRARLIQGDWPQSPELSGVFFNAVEARQLSTYLQEVLGPSDGTPNQKFEFQHKPVFEEEIRVRTQLTEEDRKRIFAEAGPDAVVDFLDETGNVIETWVLWKEVAEFADSKFDSRHYRLDRASGELRFGDRVHGDVPPIGGDNIRAFRYRSGGGVAGNVDVDTIKSLVTAIGGIDLVSNPLPAAGGSEEATRDQMIVFGPAEINSRHRAVAPTDFEFLARQASRQVVKARCIPNRDNAGMHNTGWVSVYIVGDSTEAQPQPPLELCTLVRTELLKRAPAALAASGHIFVGRPDYMLVSVAVKIAANSIAQVAQAEANTRATLEKFLHPLRGGPDGTGWEFGQGFALSALYSVIEQLDGVDHVESIEVTPQLTDDYLEIGPDQILASGTHDVSAVVAEEAEAWH